MNHNRKERLVHLLTLAKRGDLTAIDDALDLLGEWPQAESVYDGVHLIADMLEERGADPTPLADLAALAALAEDVGAPAMAMLSAVGWQEPSAVTPFMRLTQRVAERLAGPARHRGALLHCPRCGWEGDLPAPSAMHPSLAGCPTCGWLWNTPDDQQPPWEGGEVECG